MGIYQTLKKIRARIVTKNLKLANGSDISINTTFEGCNQVGMGTWFAGHMGYGSYVGANCTLDARIGRFCSISSNVNIAMGTHPTHFVSTSPMFYSTRRQTGKTFVTKSKYDELKWAVEGRYGVWIGHDVWIGWGATILGGIKIGNGAVIAAGAVVVNDVEPYSVVGGIPAKEIKKRFSEEIINKLDASNWYEKPLDWIETHADSFTDVDEFLRIISLKASPKK